MQHTLKRFEKLETKHNLTESDIRSEQSTDRNALPLLVDKDDQF